MQPASSNVLTEGGGTFLLRPASTAEVFTPEEFTDEHRAIARTTEEFWQREVVPNLERIQHGDHSAGASVLRKSAELGLTAVLVPEQYGGMELDLTSAMIVAEGIAKDGSYAAWHGAHAGIGTLPVLLYGTEEQKSRYLPKLASGEWIGAYCLSEPHAGSDALAARTRADLSADGSHYVLNGQKMWITNGGVADLYTVFAKIGGEHFTAFLVERTAEGVRPGAEERKMGIKGSSTTPLYLDNVRVPVANVLGEIGRGHIIAFNILNLGRLKLGPFAVGGAKEALGLSIKYAKDRIAFGKPISEFGMIQAKLAEMAIRIFAGESISYRATGSINRKLEGFSWQQPDAARTMLKAVEEFAAECSFVKVYASEMLDFVVDEAVQIHGGYGYHQDYLVERAYRDSRINRIFEGTNEINRLLGAGMLLKRAQRGQLGLVQAVKELQSQLLAGPARSTDEASSARLIAGAKKAAMLCLGSAYSRYGADLEHQQEVLAGIADICMHAYAMEASALRAQKHGIAADVVAVLLQRSIGCVETAARAVLAASAEGDTLRTSLAALRRFAKSDPVDEIAARRRIAARLLATGKYTA